MNREKKDEFDRLMKFRKDELVSLIINSNCQLPEVGEVKKRPSIDDVANIFCEVSGFNIADIRSRSQARKNSEPRFVAMWLSRRLSRKSHKAVGMYFGGRDHSTTCHAIQSVNDALDERSIFEFKFITTERLEEIIAEVEVNLRDNAPLVSSRIKIAL